jgi:hypothetical protein
MRLDKHDIFPLSVVLFFGILVPLGAWLALGTRQQITRDFFSLLTSFAIASFGLALFIGWFAIRSRKRERKILAERGEQAPADFVAQFASESEQRAATLILEVLQMMTAMKRMPRLERSDQLDGPPLFIVPDDLAERLETLFEELDFSFALDPDGTLALHGAKTVEELVLALAHFIERQGTTSAVISGSDY